MTEAAMTDEAATSALLANGTPTPVGGEFRVNTYTTLNQFQPAVTALSDGGFVATWASDGQDGSGWGVYGQRYDAAGAAVGDEFRANAATASYQQTPAATALANGGFVVTWQSWGQDGSGWGIYSQRYDAAGAAVGGEFRANTYTFSDQWSPAVTALADGGFVVTWTSNGQDGSGSGIYAQRYDAAGAAVGGEFRVSTTTDLDQVYPAVTALADGGFVITWTSDGQDGSGYGVYAQRYDAAGVAVGGEFQVNTYTSGSQYQPSVTAHLGGGFVVAWTSNIQDGNSFGIYAQRFAAPDGNAPPSNIELSATTVAENADGAVVGILSTVDPDADDSHAYAITDDPSGKFEVGTDADGNPVLKLKAGESLDFEDPADSSHTIEVRVTDAAGESVTRSFTITATDVNEAPTADAKTAAVDEDGSVTITPTGADPDGDDLAFSVSQQPQHGTVTVNPDGSLAYAPDPDFFGTDSFEYLATDAGGLTAPATVSITVNPVNDAPTLDPIADRQAAEDSGEQTVALTGISAGPPNEADQAPTLSVASDNAALFAELSVGAASGGQAVLTWRPAADANGAATVTVTVDDGAGGTAQRSFAIAVDPVNDAPTAVDLAGPRSVAENEAGAAIGAIGVTDVDDQDFAFAVSDGRFEVAGGMLRLKDGVSLDHEAEPSVSLEVTATDSGGLSKAASFTIAIADVNEAPSLADASLTVPENLPGGSYVGRLTAADPDAGDAVAYAITGGNEAGLFAIDAGGLITTTGPLDYEADASHQLTVTATDRGGLSGTAAILVSVADRDESNAIVGTGRADVLYGTSGDDLIRGLGSSDTLLGRAGNDTLEGGAGSDRSLDGGEGDDLLDGGDGSDRLYGDEGNDTLIGGAGADQLFGEGGADVLRFLAASDSRAGGRDEVVGFSRAEGDRIDLSAIDAVPGGADDAFAFVGTAALGGAAGELRFQKVSGATLVQADVNGDRAADFEVKLTGLSEPLQVGDFVL